MDGYVKKICIDEDKFREYLRKLQIVNKLPKGKNIEYGILEYKDLSFIDKKLNILVFKIEIIMEDRKILHKAKKSVVD